MLRVTYERLLAIERLIEAAGGMGTVESGLLRDVKQSLASIPPELLHIVKGPDIYLCGDREALDYLHHLGGMLDRDRGLSEGLIQDDKLRILFIGGSWLTNLMWNLATRINVVARNGVYTLGEFERLEVTPCVIEHPREAWGKLQSYGGTRSFDRCILIDRTS
jgi:hypothetical protein